MELVSTASPILFMIDSSTQSLQIPFQKRNDVIAGHELERRLTFCIVAARQTHRLKIEPCFTRMLHHLFGHVPGKRGVISCVQKQGPLLLARVLFPIRRRTDGRPQSSKLIRRHVAFKPFADVLRRQPFPHHIAKMRRAMVVDVHFKAIIVGAGDVGVAGSQRGAAERDALVALRLQPIGHGPHVDNRLPCGIDGAPDVRGHGVVGALQFRRHAEVVIRQCHAYRSHPEFGDPGSQRLVLTKTCIPMRQHDHSGLAFKRTTRAAACARRVKYAVHNVVFRIRRVHRRCESHHVAVVDAEIGGRLVVEKVVRMLDGELIHELQIGHRIVAVLGMHPCDRPVARPFDTPFKRSHHSIGGAETKLVFPVVHPVGIDLFHERCKFEFTKSPADGPNVVEAPNMLQWGRMTPRVLFLASKVGYQTRVFAEAAARLGYQIQLATDRCHQLADPWGDGALAFDFDDPAAISVSTFDGILAAGDVPAYVASVIAEKSGLRYHPPHAVATARNKYEARQRFAAVGLPVPRFIRVPLDNSCWLPDGYPCVLKPLGLSASRGVIRANNAVEFRAAFARIRTLLERAEIRQHRQQMDRYIQVEEFIAGREYALECLMTDGQLRVLAIFDKPDPLDGPYFEESIYVTPSRASGQPAMIAAVTRAAQALGLWHGPVHAEVRVNAAGVWILEVAARPIGGLCARALQFQSGLSLEEVLLRHAVGISTADENVREGGSAVMMIPIPKRGIYRGVTGIESAAATPGIEGLEITAMAGNELVPLPEGASYLGFLFAHALDAETAEQAVRKAHTELTFAISDVLPVLQANQGILSAQ